MSHPVMLNCSSTGVVNGKNVVILHGLFGDLNNWRAEADRLSDQYRVHCMDLRNHGESPHTPGMSYSEMAGDVAHTCKALGITSTHVVGHSMGGKTAMQLAITEDGLVDHLIVVDIGPRKYPHHHDNIIEGLTALGKSTLRSRKEAVEILTPFVAHSGVRSFLLKNIKRQKNGEYQLRINIDEIARQYDQIADAISLDTLFSNPTLFIKGAESDYLTDADRKPIADLFSNPTLKIIDGAGHWPHSEKPDVIHKIISDFLAAGSSTDSA